MVASGSPSQWADSARASWSSAPRSSHARKPSYAAGQSRALNASWARVRASISDILTQTPRRSPHRRLWRDGLLVDKIAKCWRNRSRRFHFDSPTAVLQCAEQRLELALLEERLAAGHHHHVDAHRVELGQHVADGHLGELDCGVVAVPV